MFTFQSHTSDFIFCLKIIYRFCIFSLNKGINPLTDVIVATTNVKMPMHIPSTSSITNLQIISS